MAWFLFIAARSVVKRVSWKKQGILKLVARVPLTELLHLTRVVIWAIHSPYSQYPSQEDFSVKGSLYHNFVFLLLIKYSVTCSMSTWKFGSGHKAVFSTYENQVAVTLKLPKNTLIACHLFIAAMPLVKHVIFLKEIGHKQLFAKSMTHITSKPNQSINWGILLTTHRISHSSGFFMEGSCLSQMFFHNAETKGKHAVEFLGQQGDQTSQS